MLCSTPCPPENQTDCPDYHSKVQTELHFRLEVAEYKNQNSVNVKDTPQEEAQQIIDVTFLLLLPKIPSQGPSSYFFHNVLPYICRTNSVCSSDRSSVLEELHYPYILQIT